MTILSIIILSFNTKELTLQCIHLLKTFYSKEIEDKTFEIIVADNNSHDQTIEAIQKNFSDITILQNTQNLGFAEGNNRASKQVKGTFLLFLNSDTKVINRSIIDMIEFLKNRKDVAIMGGGITDENGNMQRTAGHFLNLINIFLTLFIGGNSSRFAPKAMQEVNWVEGSFLIIKREVFEMLDGFDKEFFMYVEDMELCFRAKKAGLKTFYFPTPVAVHTGQGSSNRSFAIIQIYKGIIYFYKKHKTAFEYELVRLLLQIKALISIIIGILLFDKALVLTYKKAFQSTL